MEHLLLKSVDICTTNKYKVAEVVGYFYLPVIFFQLLNKLNSVMVVSCYENYLDYEEESENNDYGGHLF